MLGCASDYAVTLIIKNLEMQDTREPMVVWLASALESNAERAKTMVDPKVAAPDGFIVNISSVLLSLCQPFLDPSSDLAFRRIDARCKTLCRTLPQIPGPWCLARTFFEELAAFGRW